MDRFDPIKLYKQINYNADETPNENNVSFEEIFSVFKFAKEFEKKAADKISTDYSDFLSFKSRNELPQNILSLPTEAEQFFEFRKQFKAAEREPDKPEDSLARIQKLLQIEKLNRELKTLDPSTFIDLLPKEQDGMPVQDMGIAITNILSSTKFSDGERQFALNAFNGFLARGEYVAAKEYILKTANESLGVEAQTQALGRFRAMDAIDRIEFLIEKAKQAGAAPGLLTGTIEKISNKFLRQTKNPELVRLSATIKEFLITYRKSQTGVAFGAEEAKDYKKLIPDIIDYAELSTEKIVALRDALDSNQRVTYEQAIGPTVYGRIFGRAIFGVQKTVILKNPNTGEVIDVTGISTPDLTDALRQGWVQQ